jgi:hypothetical protein
VTYLIYQWWVSLEVEIRVAIIGSLSAVIAGTAGALVVVYQIGSQARAAIRQNRDNEALKLKVGIYQHILRACAVAEDTELELSSFVRFFESSVRLYKLRQSQVPQPSVPEARYPRFSELNSAAQKSAIGLVSIIEEWQIIDPRMVVFQTALNVMLHNRREAEAAYLSDCMLMMPVDVSNKQGAIFPWSPPDSGEIDVLTARSESLISSLSDLGPVDKLFHPQTN